MAAVAAVAVGVVAADQLRIALAQRRAVGIVVQPQHASAWRSAAVKRSMSRPPRVRAGSAPQIASSGSAKSLHAGAGSAPEWRKRGSAAPSRRSATAPPRSPRAHAVEIIVAGVVLADMVEAQPAPAARPVEIAGVNGARNSPGSRQPGTAQRSAAPSTRPCISYSRVATASSSPNAYYIGTMPTHARHRTRRQPK